MMHEGKEEQEQEQEQEHGSPLTQSFACSAKKEITLAGQEHKNPILSALFSQTFSQIITVDNSGLVCSWDVSSGKQITWFHARTKSGTEEEAGRKDGGEERNGRSQGKDSAQGGRGGMRKEESWKKARATSSDKPPPPLSSKNLMQHNRQQEGGEGSSNVKDKESVNPSSSSSAYTRVTAASLDLVQCRLILGWNGGGIFIYNFSSGTLLQKLVGLVGGEDGRGGRPEGRSGGERRTGQARRERDGGGGGRGL
eukprot:756337-Hanusia_phi.AAC.1